MCMTVWWWVCMYVYHMQAWGLQRSEEGIRSLELELWMVVNHHECWEQNPGPLREQQVLFLTTELSLSFPSSLWGRISRHPGWSSRCYVSRGDLRLLHLLPPPTTCRITDTGHSTYFMRKQCWRISPTWFLQTESQLQNGLYQTGRWSCLSGIFLIANLKEGPSPLWAVRPGQP